MAVTWLGTSSGAPSSWRNNSCIALRYGWRSEEQIALVDVGEGTQYQVDIVGLSLLRVSHIFITHTHGDHCFGLAALISARCRAFARSGRPPSPLKIFGPPGIIDVLLSSVHISALEVPRGGPAAIAAVEWTFARDAAPPRTVCRGGVAFTLARQPPDQARPGAAPRRVRLIGKARVPGTVARPSETVPVLDGLTWSAQGPAGLRVQAAQLKHRVPCWGYVFEEVLQRAGVGAEQRKGGADGAAHTRPRRVCILGDTCNSSAIRELADGVDVLSHEATFLSQAAQKAVVATHSTAQQAGAFARDIGAKALVLTHFSRRYQGHQKVGKGSEDDFTGKEAKRDFALVLQEARQAAGGIPVTGAHDGYTFDL